MPVQAKDNDDNVGVRCVSCVMPVHICVLTCVLGLPQPRYKWYGHIIVSQATSSHKRRKAAPRSTTPPSQVVRSDETLITVRAYSGHDSGCTNYSTSTTGPTSMRHLAETFAYLGGIPVADPAVPSLARLLAACGAPETRYAQRSGVQVCLAGATCHCSC